MAIEKRLEENADGSMSFVLEDKDNSGDLDRLMGELCKKHREAKQGINFAPLDNEKDLDQELNDKDID